ncbi:SCO family protein [Aquincola sp. S2]|uniref:SCO family protein n=1 Tax=Pseudaquabacterium terrae TaxID=2732868 RepID=A0ABX2EV24_9BURK|nr:SCO family protein [Aquabacterium terrae]NRF72389.1 SCO family protein [Aquabacterium terrae]
MRRRTLTAALLAAPLAAIAADSAAPLKAGVFEPPAPAPAFALRGSDGSADLGPARFRGKVLVMSFGFTNCAAVCPTTLATLAEARRALGPAGADVQVMFVTVDPQRDDAARLKTYVQSFDPGFVGATGTPQALADVRKRYGVTATRVPMGDSYAVDHTSSVYLIDRAGRLRAMMPYGRAAKDYVHDLRILVAQ